MSKISTFHFAVDRSKLARTIVEAEDGSELAETIGNALGALIKNEWLDDGTSHLLAACGINPFRLGEGNDLRRIEVNHDQLSTYLDDKRAITPDPFDSIGRRIVAAMLTKANFKVADTGISLIYLPAHEAV